MLNRRFVLAFLFALPFALVSCEINTINSFPENPAHVRMMNAIPDSGAVNVTVDGNAAWSALAFESTTAYMDFNNTQLHVFNVNLVGSASTLMSATYNLAGTASYTLLAFGNVEAPLLALMPDDTVAPPAGNFLMRVANVAYGAGFLDFYITSPTATLDNVSPNLSGIPYAGSTGFIQFTAGTYRMRFTESGTKTVIYDSGSQTFPGGATIDTIAYTRNGGLQCNVSVAYVNGSQQSMILNSTMAALKVFNAAYQTGSVNMYVDGVTTPFVSNLVYPSASGYNFIPSGMRTLGFEAVSTPGAIIATASPTLAGATDSTALLTGLAGAEQVVVLNDLNYPPLVGNTRLRVVNASPDAPPITMTLSGTQQFAGLAYPTASSYLEFAGNTYNLVFTDPAGNTLLTLSNIIISAGQTNSLYLVGPVASLAGVFTQDN